MHFAVCTYWMERKNGSPRVAATLSGHASWLPPTCDSGKIQTEQEQESKRAEGENMAAEDYHFDIKRMLSQQSNRAAPVNCDTIQLLVTLKQGEAETYCKSSEHAVY